LKGVKKLTDLLLTNRVFCKLKINSIDSN
jgi:hypothetical protein